MMILTIRRIIVSAYIFILLTNNAHIASDMSVSDVANESSILSTEEGMKVLSRLTAYMLIVV
jgi:hypothetical protein